MEKTKTVAVLIDAENVEAEHFEHINSEVPNYGLPIVKRIYGDWSSNGLKE